MDFLAALDSGDLVSVTRAAISAARDGGSLRDADMAACVAILELAAKIQVQDDYFDALMEDAVENGRRPPSQDNVSLPTFLKYAESLGLTPAGRGRMAPPVKAGEPAKTAPAPEAKEVADDGKPSNVTQLRGPIQRQA